MNPAAQTCQFLVFILLKDNIFTYGQQQNSSDSITNKCQINEHWVDHGLSGETM